MVECERAYDNTEENSPGPAHPAVVVRVDLLEFLPEAVEVDEKVQQLAELPPPDEAVPVRVRRLVGPHDRRLVVVPREDLHDLPGADHSAGRAAGARDLR